MLRVSFCQRDVKKSGTSLLHSGRFLFKAGSRDWRLAHETDKVIKIDAEYVLTQFRPKAEGGYVIGLNTHEFVHSDGVSMGEVRLNLGKGMKKVHAVEQHYG